MYIPPIHTVHNALESTTFDSSVRANLAVYIMYIMVKNISLITVITGSRECYGLTTRHLIMQITNFVHCICRNWRCNSAGDTPTQSLSQMVLLVIWHPENNRLPRLRTDVPKSKEGESVVSSMDVDYSDQVAIKSQTVKETFHLVQQSLTSEKIPLEQIRQSIKLSINNLLQSKKTE